MAKLILKELVINDKALIIQMISARDKSTGLYLPMQDGNVNSMLHRIFNNLDVIERVYMTLPAKKFICPLQIVQLENINFDLLKSSVIFLFDDDNVLYGSDVAKSREKIRFRPVKALIEKTKPEHVVCEFPVFIQFINNFNNKNVQYNFNWNKVSDDDTSPSAKSFEDEMLIAEYFDVFLFSSIQYNYMKSKDVNDNLRIYRSCKIYNEKFIRAVSSMYLNGHYDESTAKTIDDIFEDNADDGILFFPSRVDDPRYDFQRIAALSEKCELPLLVANHLNVDLKKHTTSELTYVKDYAKLIPQEHNRFAYFYTLTKLRKDDLIFREENDMHISLIEQVLLVDDNNIVSHKFHTKTVNSYIYNK